MWTDGRARTIGREARAIVRPSGRGGPAAAVGRLAAWGQPNGQAADWKWMCTVEQMFESVYSNRTAQEQPSFQLSSRVRLDLVKGLILAFSCAPGPEERKGFYEENADAEDMIVRLSRPFLILC